MLIIALGFSTLFGTITLNMSRHSLDSIRSFSDHYAHTMARNASTSGVYMTLSKLYQDNTWRGGFSNLSLNGSDLNVTKTSEVLLGLPPDLADLAVFVTDTIDNVSIYDEMGNPDPTLAIENAPEMLPFDKDGLVSLAQSQNTPSSHVIAGDFAANNNWPNGNFYYDEPNNIPNVTHVLGNLTVGGGTDVYGIFVVEGNVTLDGNARVQGVIYLPNPGSIVIHGGGNPNESSITGGVFANGSINGTGNHISVRYKREYMEIFGSFQTAKNMFIVSWKESPSY